MYIINAPQQETIETFRDVQGHHSTLVYYSIDTFRDVQIHHSTLVYYPVYSLSLFIPSILKVLLNPMINLFHLSH